MHNHYQVDTLEFYLVAKWNIKLEQVHLILRDNISNMMRTMSDSGFEDLGCFAHTLQLVIHNGMYFLSKICQRYLSNLPKYCGSF